MADRPTDTALGILARSRVFQAAPSADLERLAVRCSCERYRKGAEILRRGGPGDFLAVLGRGRVKATLPAPGAEGEFLVGLFWPGDVFGEIAVFDQLARVGTGIAITEAEVAFVPRSELMPLLERRPAVAIRMVETLCEKLRIALDLSLSMRFLDVPSRFYQRLLYLARFDSRRDGDGLRIHHGLSQHELADSIGASREALNKVIADWKRAGLLEWGRGYVVVRDPALLAQKIPPGVRYEAFTSPSALLPATESRPGADRPRSR
jgi:CRP/FNR family transcriptional regulator, cyclic AMP receptor protein